ncbi:MaoC family dehydratase N-terminal domain-containing protein [Limibaculum sp. FT325]|uniref:FAS1-like dehydratase domain-containing protein n=1 Tax=Thermohalobaculum sediminis TaxID=2939436 RepID=UPI0020BD5A31|nr:MaoC family dehydratase N-terminal domain-containing protein [Limibaculum sediminis]MCL5778169.1 MaoC family dehydratase N-terminal domain-containing protein [Limibaculum sediminis]
MTTPNPADWIGRSRTETDPMHPWAANALVATLGLARAPFGPGDALPPFWHWMHFLEARPRADLGPDGHPATGGFMPAVRQPRRMWAGGRVEFPGPLPLDAPATRHSTIADVAEKTGRAGEMTFVTVRHEISGAAGLAVVEEQDIVYRFDPAPGTPWPAPRQAATDETARRDWSLGPVELFRYSALTFNGHRIHYDLRHATETEGYPGLVVHGPLLATLLLELAGEMARARPIGRFAFRAVAPVFADEPFAACAREGAEGLQLWVRASDGRLAMEASAGL